MSRLVLVFTRRDTHTTVQSDSQLKQSKTNTTGANIQTIPGNDTRHITIEMNFGLFMLSELGKLITACCPNQNIESYVYTSAKRSLHSFAFIIISNSMLLFTFRNTPSRVATVNQLLTKTNLVSTQALMGLALGHILYFTNLVFKSNRSSNGPLVNSQAKRAFTQTAHKRRRTGQVFPIDCK